MAEPGKFRAGMGITILDDAQVARLGRQRFERGWREGAYLLIRPMTLRDYDSGAETRACATRSPSSAPMNAEKVMFEDIIVDGNRAENDYIDGCRGGAIYLNTVRDVTVRNCVARNYNGDGISFQITDR